MAQSRIRVSLNELVTKYPQDPRPLENLVRAFRVLQSRAPNYNLPPEEDLSFFRIAGFHGEPFEGPGRYDGGWWGGYCHHNDVLFPVWHRAYLMHLEDALRAVPGCEDVTLPFWDETFDSLNGKTGIPIPGILTSSKLGFQVDGDDSNPFFSYKLRQALVEDIPQANSRYTKPEGYETVRYPLSGLVGTQKDRDVTKAHNAEYSDANENVKISNSNVRAWMDGTVKIDTKDQGEKTKLPDTYSVLSRFKQCLQAPTYTWFSNKKSATEFRTMGVTSSDELTDVVSLEQPHNSIHLALGGFFQYDVYNADPIRNANGDMGDNETAGFDPIFFFHHCFIDYVFHLWQVKHGMTERGNLTIDANDPGARCSEGTVGTAVNAILETTTPLTPFRNNDENRTWRTLEDVTDIVNQLGYSYGTGSLDPLVYTRPGVPAEIQPHDTPDFIKIKSTDPIDRSQYPGSFVIRTFARVDGKETEVGREAILSRWYLQSCDNCMTRLTTNALTPVSRELETALLGESGKKAEEIEYYAKVEHRLLSPDRLDAPMGFGEKTVPVKDVAVRA